MFNLSKFLVRQTHHELVYPELVLSLSKGLSKEEQRIREFSSE